MRSAADASQISWHINATDLAHEPVFESHFPGSGADRHVGGLPCNTMATILFPLERRDSYRIIDTKRQAMVIDLSSTKKLPLASAIANGD